MKRKTVSLLLAVAVLTSLFAGYRMPAKAADELIKLGDYITMGTYSKNYYSDPEPIKWRCVAFEKVVGYDENGNPIMDSTQTVTEPTTGYLPLMLADVYLSRKLYDAPGDDTSGSHDRGEYRKDAAGNSSGNGGSNYWGDSALRIWLNSKEEKVSYPCGNPPARSMGTQSWEAKGFLTNFTEEELARIKPVTQKTRVAKCDYDYLSAQSSAQIGGSTDFGKESKSWSKGTSFEQVMAGYDTAYYELMTDTMFILDLQQTKNVFDNGTALGDPDYYTTAHKNADYSDVYTQFGGFVRAPANFDNYVVYLDAYGKKFFSTPAAYLDITIRPAFYLNEMPAAEPDPTPTPEPTPTPTPEPTPTPTPEPTPTPTPEPTPTPTPEPTPTPTPEPTPTPTPEPTPTPTPEPTPTSTPEPTPTPTPEPTPTPTPEPPPTPTPEPTPDPAPDDDDDSEPYRPASTASSKPASAPASKPTETPKPSETPKPTETPKPEPSQPPASVEQFADVAEDAWYYAPVKNAVEKGLMVGMDDGEFAPEAEITRAMFVTVLYRMAGEPELSGEALDSSFADVEGDSWYTNAVYWAKLNGIVEGHSVGAYAPHEGISREQLAVTVYRFAKWKQQDMQTSGSLSYTDQSGISDYAKDAVLWNADNGIMQGHDDNTFDPQAKTTRAQAAAIFERLMEMLK